MNTDLQDALIAWQGGELPEDRTEALLKKLRVDASFRLALAEQVWTLSLTKIAQSPDPRWITLHEEIGLIEGDFEKTLMNTVRCEPLRLVSAGWRWATALAAAAVVVLAALLVFRQPTAADHSETLAVLVPASHQEASRPIGTERLQLAGGKARLLFINGVILDVEGPADLDLLSLNRVICREGRLRTQVPPGAEGFCVETPRGNVTDLGTVLGISVAKTGKTDVNVFEGQAELSARLPGQAGLRTAVLNQHEKASLGSSRGVIGSSDAMDFLDAVEPESPAMPWTEDHARRVLVSKPAHYWRLNRMENGRIANEIADGPALLIGGEVEITSSARFRGRQAPGVLHSERPWRPDGGHWAMEFWFMPESLDQMALAALTTADATRPHMGLVEMGGRRPGEAVGPGVMRYLLRWPAGHRDGLNLFSGTNAALPYQWHHIVAQQHAGKMELYLDGQLIGPAQSEAAPSAMDAILQLGALEFRPGQDSTKLRRAFQGRLAEVALYDRVLDADEVREHSRRR